jgi:hypothetical protein
MKTRSCCMLTTRHAAAVLTLASRSRQLRASLALRRFHVTKWYAHTTCGCAKLIIRSTSFATLQQQQRRRGSSRCKSYAVRDSVDASAVECLSCLLHICCIGLCMKHCRNIPTAAAAAAATAAVAAKIAASHSQIATQDRPHSTVLAAQPHCCCCCCGASNHRLQCVLPPTLVRLPCCAAAPSLQRSCPSTGPCTRAQMNLQPQQQQQVSCVCKSHSGSARHLSSIYQLYRYIHRVQLTDQVIQARQAPTCP